MKGNTLFKEKVNKRLIFFSVNNYIFNVNFRSFQNQRVAYETCFLLVDNISCEVIWKTQNKLFFYIEIKSRKCIISEGGRREKLSLIECSNVITKLRDMPYLSHYRQICSTGWDPWNLLQMGVSWVPPLQRDRIRD